MNKVLKIVLVSSVCLIATACANLQGNDPIKDPTTPVYNKKSVYFATNSTTVEKEFQTMLKAHAGYLKSNTEKKLYIIVQGNTDERGSNAFNKALGKRRADAVKKFLVNQGVKANQIETVSFGEDLPVDLRHNEEGWKMNRRVDIVYK